jgi:5-methylcytosine-specific restriction endonuclease McrA
MSETETQSPARYRIQVIVNREIICSPANVDETVSFELGRLASMGCTCVGHNVTKIKEKPQKKRLGEFTLDDVIPYIATCSQRNYVANGHTYTVRMNSQRYFVFRDSPSCVACGLTGTKMILEQHPGDKTAHFNLYAEENGELVLMTKDHIRARSAGGEDRHSNYQTMCSICNNIKAHESVALEDLRNLRAIYNRHVNTMAKRELHKVLEEAKRQVVRKSLQEAKWDATYITQQDLNVFVYTDGELEAVSVYAPLDGEHVSCICKGCPMSGTVVNGWFVAELVDGTKVRMPSRFVRLLEKSGDDETGLSDSGTACNDFAEDLGEVQAEGAGSTS